MCFPSLSMRDVYICVFFQIALIVASWLRFCWWNVFHNKPLARLSMTMKYRSPLSRYRDGATYDGNLCVHLRVRCSGPYCRQTRRKAAQVHRDENAGGAQDRKNVWQCVCLSALGRKTALSPITTGHYSRWAEQGWSRLLWEAKRSVQQLFSRLLDERRHGICQVFLEKCCSKLLSRWSF